MRILVCGSSGFIGRHVCAALVRDGHSVARGTSRSTAGGAAAGDAVAMDFASDTDPAIWLPRLKGIDAVVNAVGVLRDTRQRPIQRVHDAVPSALFEACAAAGVQRVVHISALGIDHSDTAYATTKRAAEQRLKQLADSQRLCAAVLRPSVVFGAGGASAAMFMGLARLPALLLPGPVIRARIQPVAVADVADAVAALLGERAQQTGTVPCVGPTPLTMAGFVATLRQQLGHGPARTLALPDFITRLSARVGDHVPVSPWCSESLALLAHDNVAPCDAFTALLGRAPLSPDRFVAQSWA